jgi:hypothetical protein
LKDFDKSGDRLHPPEFQFFASPQLLLNQLHTLREARDMLATDHRGLRVSITPLVTCNRTERKVSEYERKQRRSVGYHSKGLHEILPSVEILECIRGCKEDPRTPERLFTLQSSSGFNDKINSPCLPFDKHVRQVGQVPAGFLHG